MQTDILFCGFKKNSHLCLCQPYGFFLKLYFKFNIFIQLV